MSSYEKRKHLCIQATVCVVAVILVVAFLTLIGLQARVSDTHPTPTMEVQMVQHNPLTDRAIHTVQPSYLDAVTDKESLNETIREEKHKDRNTQK